MNIKVAAFTVSEKSNYKIVYRRTDVRSGQDDVSHTHMASFFFVVSDLWPFNCFLCLFCVIFILEHSITQ